MSDNSYNHVTRKGACKTENGTLLSPASSFTLEELTEAYNQTRIDYIVPMPMNVSRLQEYIHNYDVDMDHSAVATYEGQILGIAMLGIRDDTTWITRLGVLPVKRRRGTGQILMEALIEESYRLQAHTIILEVIKGNVPAHRLFHKLGFRETRDLLVLRRPPTHHLPDVAPYSVDYLDPQSASTLLDERRSHPSWLDQAPSLRNAGNLEALRVELADGSYGWLVYQHNLFQLGRLVLQPEQGNHLDVARALMHALHSRYPRHDTKHENLPAHDPLWPVLKEFDYLVSFRRIEMELPLDT
jgi:ribosomal protein S18 acetylase RimI-like enzyme